MATDSTLTRGTAAAVLAHIDRLDSWQDQAPALRAQLSASVAAQRQRQRAARILDEQRVKRTAQREARAAAAAASATATIAQLASGQRANVDLLAAARRDQYRAALGYPMAADELVAACDQALDDAHVRPGEDRDESRAMLRLHVIRRHGNGPLRCDIGRDYLKRLASRFALEAHDQRERATGRSESAALHAQWAAQDAASASSLDSGPDAVYRLAENLPAPAPEDPADQLSADEITERFASRLRLTARQSDALMLSLSYVERVTVALSGAQKKAAHDARAIVRQRYPTIDALRAALRGPDALRQLAATLAVDSAIAVERQRAQRAARGSHLSGQRDSASSAARPLTWRYGPRRLIEVAPRDTGGYGGALRGGLIDWPLAAGGAYRVERTAAQRTAAAQQQRAERERRQLRQRAPLKVSAGGFAPQRRQRPADAYCGPRFTGEHRAAARAAGLSAMAAKPRRTRYLA